MEALQMCFSLETKIGVTKTKERKGGYFGELKGKHKVSNVWYAHYDVKLLNLKKDWLMVNNHIKKDTL